MSDATDNPQGDEAVAHAAAAWVLRQDRGLTAAEQDEFLQWLAGDPRHAAQLARHRKNWRRRDACAVAPRTPARDPTPICWLPRAGACCASRPSSGSAAAAAAAVAVVLVLKQPAAVVPGGGARRVPAVVAQVVSPVTQQTLEDGNGCRTQQRRAAYRAVHRGRAASAARARRGAFYRDRDPARPFIVNARRMDVAVGTAFNVRLDSAVVEVLVTEGKVRVSEAQAAPVVDLVPVPRPPVVPLLEAGQRAGGLGERSARGARIATLTPGEIERVLSWQHRMLDFTAAPLSEVVSEFNRRNGVQLVIAEPELAAVRISATFRSDNIEGFVSLLEIGFSARAERRGENEIWLRKAR